MREIEEIGALEVLSSGVYSALRFCAIGEPLLPNLKSLSLWPAIGKFIPHITLFLSPRTTTITIVFIEDDYSIVAVASLVATLPTLCPNLEAICLRLLEIDPMIIAAVSQMLLTTNLDTLRSLRVDSPFTEEAREVIYKLPGLCDLTAVIERDTLLPSATLPNLANLTVQGDHDNDLLRVFHGATFGRLESVTFSSGSAQIGDFLEAFERVALAASTQNTLTEFCLYASCSWHPNYLSLLPFTQLTTLFIEFLCDDGCVSTVDDDVITNLARTMPKLETLRLGDDPCHLIPTGVTVKGLVALSHHCQDLSTLRVHFQVASLSAPPGVGSNPRSITLRRECALKELEVGGIPMPEEASWWSP